MTIVQILRDAVRAMETSDDFRKEAPVAIEVKRQILRAIVELQTAQAGRLSPESVPAQGNENTKVPGRAKESA